MPIHLYPSQADQSWDALHGGGFGAAAGGKTMPEPGLAAYKGIFDSTVEDIVVVDAATGQVALANKAAATIFGFDSPKDMVGSDPLRYIPQEDRERVAASMVENTFEKDLHRVMELKVRGWAAKRSGPSLRE